MGLLIHAQIESIKTQSTFTGTLPGRDEVNTTWEKPTNGYDVVTRAKPFCRDS